MMLDVPVAVVDTNACSLSRARLATVRRVEDVAVDFDLRGASRNTTESTICQHSSSTKYVADVRRRFNKVEAYLRAETTRGTAWLLVAMKLLRSFLSHLLHLVFTRPFESGSFFHHLYENREP